MRSRRLVLAALALGACRTAPPPALAPAPAADPDLREVAAQLTVAILVHRSPMADLRALVGFGSRMTGTAGLDAATGWAVGTLREAGFAEVRLEPVPVEHGWIRGDARVAIVSPVAKVLRARSIGWSPPTPAGGIRAPLVWLPDLEPEHLGGPELAGAVVMFDEDQVFAGGFAAATAKIAAAYGPLVDAGAVAVLWRSWLPGTEFKAHLHFSDEVIAPLPGVDVAADDAAVLTELVGKGPVIVELHADNQVSGPFDAHNVIAELRGRELPDEWVLVGAHLDSWDASESAQDNGTGVAMVIGAARAIAALGVAPRRSIRFALWTAEEESLLGSRAYLAAHRDELAGCIAVLNMDHGAGQPSGWDTGDRADVAAALAPMGELLEGLGGAITAAGERGSDEAPFVEAGVPGLNLVVDGSRYMEIHHRAGDTIDRVAPHALAAATAIVAISAYWIAETQAPRRLLAP